MAASPRLPRKPDFLILGAAKAGTTALFYYLGQHPEVFTPSLRETNFFALEGQTPRFAGPGDDAAVNQKAITSWEAYTALFADAGSRKTGECSPLYLYHPEAPARIATRLPEVRLIVLLRNPADRAYASYLHLVRDGRETAPTFAEGLEREDERVAAGWEHLWHYRRMGFYGDQLARYLQAVPASRLHLLDHETLETRPIDAFAGVCRFLGIDDRFVPDFSRRVNRSGIPRLPGLYRQLVRESPVRRLGRTLLPLGIRGRVHTALQQLFLTRPSLPTDLRASLLEGYREDAERLTRLTGFDTSPWFAPHDP